MNGFDFHPISSYPSTWSIIDIQKQVMTVNQWTLRLYTWMATIFVVTLCWRLLGTSVGLAQPLTNCKLFAFPWPNDRCLHPFDLEDHSKNDSITIHCSSFDLVCFQDSPCFAYLENWKYELNICFQCFKFYLNQILILMRMIAMRFCGFDSGLIVSIFPIYIPTEKPPIPPQ